MSKRVFDKAGDVTEYFYYDESEDVAYIETVQDVEPYIEHAKAARNDTDITKHGIKNGWWHIAHIPDSIILKMRFEDGVNVYDRNDWAQVGKLLNEKYPAFKLTDGKHKFKS